MFDCEKEGGVQKDKKKINFFLVLIQHFLVLNATLII